MTRTLPTLIVSFNLRLHNKRKTNFNLNQNIRIIFCISARVDRYHHDLDMEDSVVSDDNEFGFSSCSQKYRSNQGRNKLSQVGSMESLDSSETGSDGSKDNTNASGVLNTSGDMATEIVQVEAGNKTIPGKLVTQLSAMESSSEDVSPQLQRRRRGRETLPRFSISAIPDSQLTWVEKNEDGNSSIKSPPHPINESTPSSSPLNLKQSRSSQGLSLQIPGDTVDASYTLSTPVAVASPGGGSSSASSRDSSPSRDLCNSLKPPIIIKKGPRGFGFTIRAIRVFFGDSNVYTVQHLVKDVVEGSPAFEAGLRAGDLITQVLVKKLYFDNTLLQ